MTKIETRNKAIVRRIYEDMWNRADLDTAGEIFAQPEGVRKFVGEFLSAFPDLHHTVEGMLAEGDQVVARFSAQGTHTGQWKEYTPHGKTVHYTGVTIVRIEGDKIVEHHTWWDKWEVIEQISG